MHPYRNAAIALTGALLAASAVTAAADDTAANPDENSKQFTYAWPFSDDDAMRPRGGTTEGPGVELDTSTSDAWLALREPGLSKKERDRRAILAMAGGYRTSFDFIETIGFVEGYSPDRPYQSWGTEYVYVVADEPDFISLQHIIVMFFETPDGQVEGPAVVKHWRQDWDYEDTEFNVYVGHNTWEQRILAAERVQGTWSQAVYQVDDSPRYQATGTWQHHGNYSAWTSGKTWRPLPRREFSVRDDYHALVGTNRHVITPTGWVQEEDNLKLVLYDDGKPRDEAPYLAREAGLARYERIAGHDFSAGDDYWARTGPFWADVREAWRERLDSDARLTLKKQVDDRPLFAAVFEYAGSIEAGAYDQAAGRAFIERTLDAYLADAPASGAAY